MPDYIYGIDFGTSNSALAILDTRTDKVLKVISKPSVLFFPADSTDFHVGQEAIDMYVESRMRGRFMKSIKRVLPNQVFIETRVGSKRYKAEDLVALFISALKKEADEFLGEDIRTAVIGRPVVFDEDPKRDALAQDRLRKAAKIAGFETLYFQFEPVGAAFAFERNIQAETLGLVADFGGGTSDFSLMRLNPTRALARDRSADMVAKGGVYIGGDSFDSAIMWHRGTPHFGRGLTYQSQPGKWLPLPTTFFQQICSWEKMNFFDSVKVRNDIENYYFMAGKPIELRQLSILVGQNLGYKLFQRVEAAKIQLSKAETGLFEVDFEGIEFTESISLQSFADQVIAADTGKIMTYLDAFLNRHSIAPESVQSVFMTGGTSLVRPLQAEFAKRFGAGKLVSGDNFNSVVVGLAHSYKVLAEG